MLFLCLWRWSITLHKITGHLSLIVLNAKVSWNLAESGSLTGTEASPREDEAVNVMMMLASKIIQEHWIFSLLLTLYSAPSLLSVPGFDSKNFCLTNSIVCFYNNQTLISQTTRTVVLSLKPVLVFRWYDQCSRRELLSAGKWRVECRVGFWWHWHQPTQQSSYMLQMRPVVIVKLNIRVMIIFKKYHYAWFLYSKHY